MKHILRFGTHAESKYFREFKNTYDAVIFNGNMVAYTPPAIAGFIASIKKPYLIDPQTHAFQHDIYKLSKIDKDGNLVPKQSFLKLAEKFGDPVKQKIGKESLLPEDFKTEEMKNDFCVNVIKFQLNIIEEYIKNGSENVKSEHDYIKFVLEHNETDIKSKLFGVVPPYFYMNSSTIEKWLPLNIEFIKIAQDKFKEENICAQIVLSKNILMSDNLEKIINEYQKLDCKNILVWVDDFDETSVGYELLKKFLKLIKELSKNKNVINLYGGYFSVLLTKQSSSNILSGVCHGLGYGENRAVAPVGGGIPMAKYYFPPLHKRMRFTDFIKILIQMDWEKNTEEFKRKVCGCKMCNDGDFKKFGESKAISFKRGNQIIKLNYPTSSTKECSLKHYLYVKHREFTEDKNKNDLLDDLENSFNKYKRILGLEETSYIMDWKRLI